MPSLNNDILLEVVAEIGRMYQGAVLNKALAKFMLSGREPFAATLQLLSKATCINFRYSTFDVLGKDWSFSGIKYYFPLLQPILSVLKNVTKIAVLDGPSSAQGLSVEELAMFDKVVTKNIKEVDLHVRLPDKQMALLQEYKLNTIKLFEPYSQHKDGCYVVTFTFPPVPFFEF